MDRLKGGGGVGKWWERSGPRADDAQKEVEDVGRRGEEERALDNVAEGPAEVGALFVTEKGRRKSTYEGRRRVRGRGGDPCAQNSGRGGFKSGSWMMPPSRITHLSAVSAEQDMIVVDLPEGR